MDEHMGHSYTKDRKVLMNRLSRLEGQVRGIGRMVDGEEYCVDILQQIAALRAAVDALPGDPCPQHPADAGLDLEVLLAGLGGRRDQR